MEIALCLAFMAGIGALALVMNAIHQVHGEQINQAKFHDATANRIIATLSDIEDLLDVQPPLADEKPQAVQVTIKPTAKTMTAWMDFEASQKAALDEFKEN